MDIMAAVDVVPSSPPGLDSSRSSTKSSSLRSSLPQDNIHDISHFEDIVLSESPSPSSSPSVNIIDLYSSPSLAGSVKTRPPLRGLTHLANLPKRSAISTSNIHSPNLRNTLTHSDPITPKVIQQNHSPRGSWPSSPDFSAPATSHLRPNQNARMPSLNRSQTYGSPSLSQSASTSSDGLSHPVRRSSWQPTRRKSTRELEEEYDDLDEELPDDAIIWNIPLSPRPRGEIQSLSTPSLSNESQQSTDDTLSTTFPVTPRTKSWDEALSGLTPEIQKLTNELEAHSDPFESKMSPSSTSRPSFSPRQSGGSVVLPPIQRSNNIVDPLPISKVKEKFLTRTRPSWLPPKCPKEEKRHLKEYQRMMSKFWDSEKQKSLRKSKSVAAIVSEKTSTAKAWQVDVLDNWENAISSPRLRELWWQGVPATFRADVWAKTIGNELHLSSQSYKAALGRADRSNVKMRKSPTAKNILLDVASTFPDTKLFQQSQTLHEALLNVLHAYAAYRSDADYIKGTSGITAILLYVFHGDEEKAFVNLANVMNRTISLIYCLGDDTGIERVERYVQTSVQRKMPHLAEHLRRVMKNSQNGLAVRDGTEVTSCGEYSGWLDLMCTSLFTGILNMEDCLRVWDVMLFEDDSFVLQAAVGVLHAVEDRLYSCDIVAIDGLLGWHAWSQRAEYGKPTSGSTSYKRGLFGTFESKRDGLDVGGPDRLISAIRWAGKEMTYD